MSFSRNNNIIESDDSDLDPTSFELNDVKAPMAQPVKLRETSPSIGFNSYRLTLNANTPIKLVGHDPARLRMLLNTSVNADVLIGDQATVTASSGFNLTTHNAGGSIEVNTTEEIWATLVSATASDTCIVYLWIERSATN